ncbi:hypothetical protein V5799_006437 [Amblyomma americanum]|uniref:Uncharacterized protein n=1 Tax=Amblyomma americanum TaxID=6943 RepID=A0AAQ4DWE3_AMBAM
MCLLNLAADILPEQQHRPKYYVAHQLELWCTSTWLADKILKLSLNIQTHASLLNGSALHLDKNCKQESCRSCAASAATPRLFTPTSYCTRGFTPESGRFAAVTVARPSKAGET